MKHPALPLIISVFGCVLTLGAGCSSSSDSSGGSGGTTTAGGKGGASAGTSSGGASAGTTSGGTGGAASGGSAGSGGSGGAAPPACVSVPAGVGNSSLLEDFETLSGDISSAKFATADKLTGGFYDYVDKGGMETLIADGPGYMSAKAGHLNIMSGTAAFGGMGVYFQCYNGAAYTGLHFWEKGSADESITLTVETAESRGTATGGNCLANCTNFGTNFKVSADWTEHTVKWSDLTGGPGTFDPKTLLSVNFHWTKVKAANVDIWLDDLGFISNGNDITDGAGGAPGAAGAGTTP